MDDIRREFLDGKISKSEFIQRMYQEYHAKLFEYATCLKRTRIASIEITNDAVTMISRDKGVKMLCPVGDHRVAPIEILNFFDYEATDSAMILRLVAPDDCVLDIGANMGWYSINIAKTYPSCNVHAFEPIPKTYLFLKQNIELNQVPNVAPHCFGLSSERKDLVFFFYPDGSGNASSKNLSGRADAESVTCRVERLDDFVNANKLHVDFIKCDVEGAEWFVFQGAAGTLRRDRPIVFSEMLRKWSARFNYHPNEIIAFFSALGYRCFYVDGSTLKELVEMADETKQTNFFFLHSEKHDRLIKELSV
jgi:FkbM family methyltransferase